MGTARLVKVALSLAPKDQYAVTILNGVRSGRNSIGELAVLGSMFPTTAKFKDSASAEAIGTDEAVLARIKTAMAERFETA